MRWPTCVWQPLHLSTSTMVKSNSQFHFFFPMFHWFTLVGRRWAQTFVRGSGFIRSESTSLHCLQLFGKKTKTICRYWEHLDLRLDNFSHKASSAFHAEMVASLHMGLWPNNTLFEDGYCVKKKKKYNTILKNPLRQFDLGRGKLHLALWDSRRL